jgi:SNF2 family DNA or RNA helicase
MNNPLRDIPPMARPAVNAATAAMNPYATHVPPRQVIDLTRPRPRQNKDSDDESEDSDRFDPDAEIKANSHHFGAPDPYMYLDSSKANEDIAKLLEGAFDDEAEKGKTRLRSRVKKVEKQKEEEKSTNRLADKLAALNVDEAAKQDEDEDKDDEEEDEEDGTVEGLEVKLLPHQVEGVSWMIDKEIGRNKTRNVLPKGGILADDMGLGKTVQSVALLLTNPRPAIDAKPEYKGQKLPKKEVGKGTLVVAPLALIKQWEGEIKTKVSRKHAMKVLVHHGPSRTKDAAQLKKYDVVITTYQTLTSEHAGSNMAVAGGARIGCFGVHWYRIMLDEAHSIKNRNAKSTQACCALESYYRWCLTGTPMQNNLDELQSLIKFLRIKPYCELPRWKESITMPMKNGRGGLAMQRLNVFLKAFMKRRTKDILKLDGALNFGGKSDKDGANKGGMQIVKREVCTVVCDFDAEEKEYYDRLQARADRRLEQMMEQGQKTDYIGALVLLLRLRQMCDHPQLIEMALSDRDPIKMSAQEKSSQGMGDEMDALTALMGGVTVESKNCDVCQVKLSAAEARDGAIRCSECEADLVSMKETAAKKKDRKVKTEKKSKHAKHGKDVQVKAEPKREVRRARNRKVIVDSDDEDEEEGEWIAGGPEQKINLGKAGGSDDEDAEGGGETLDSIDSDRSDEDDSQVDDSLSRTGKMKVVDSDDETEASIRTDEDEATDVSEAEEEDGTESDESGFLEGMGSTNRPKHAPSTKIRQLLRILHAETPKYKTIVFSQFTTMLDLIEPHLRHANIRFVRYDGSMRPDAREQALSSLRNDSKTRVLLCSLKCGSLGLNLTAASRVVIIEPFWNPFVEEQAIDRVHRLNQTVDVKVFRLTIRDSVEERILELQEKKRELAKAAIEGGKGMGNLSMKDILGLFKHDVEVVGSHADDEEFSRKFGHDQRLISAEPSLDVGHAVASAGAREGSRSVPRKVIVTKGSTGEHAIYGRRW